MITINAARRRLERGRAVTEMSDNGGSREAICRASRLTTERTSATSLPVRKKSRRTPAINLDTPPTGDVTERDGDVTADWRVDTL